MRLMLYSWRGSELFTKTRLDMKVGTIEELVGMLAAHADGEVQWIDGPWVLAQWVEDVEDHIHHKVYKE